MKHTPSLKLRWQALVCIVCAGLIQSCVTTDELYADYEDLNCQALPVSSPPVTPDPIKPETVAAEPVHQCPVVVESKTPEPEPRTVPEQLRYALQLWQPVVFFDSDSSALSADAVERLQVAVDILNKVSDTNVALQGFADHHGAIDYNLRLARRRAEAVRDWLVQKGLDQRRISVRAMGEGLTSFAEDSERWRADSRRVELMLLDQQGLPVVRVYEPEND